MTCGFVELMLRTNRTSAVRRRKDDSLFLTPSTRIRGLDPCDEKYAALAEGHSELSLNVPSLSRSLLDIAVHLIDVAFGLKLTVASRLPTVFSTLLWLLEHVLACPFCHYRSMSR